MKRKLSLAIVMMMIVTLLASTALAWYCPNCGANQSGNFCSECGTKKPASSSSTTTTTTSSSNGTITNMRAATGGNGDVVVKWNGGTAPYTVTYSTSYWTYSYYEEDKYYDTRADLQRMIPGVDYTIYIKDANGKSGSFNYKINVESFSEFTMKDGLRMPYKTFSLSEYKSYSAKRIEFRIHWPNLKKTRDYKAKLVMKTPKGYAPRVVVYPSWKLENKYVYRWDDFNFASDYIPGIEDNFGSVPTGTYTLEMYFNGKLYGTVNFRMN